MTSTDQLIEDPMSHVPLTLTQLKVLEAHFQKDREPGSKER
jgi:hypothetical protein